MKLRDYSHILNSTPVIKNVRTSSNDLVKRVLAEETTYENESKKLMTYSEEEFYSQRDKLIDALNLYNNAWIGPPTEEIDKETLNYELLHSELKELKKKKLMLNIVVPGLIIGGVGFFSLFLAGLVVESVILTLSAYTGTLGSSIRATTTVIDRSTLRSKKFLPHHSALRSYACILKKSKRADDFTHDMPFLEEEYPVKYESSEIKKLYENDTEGFINLFSSLKKAEEQEWILRLLYYNSEYENEDVISWLDKNEPELVKKVGLDL